MAGIGFELQRALKKGGVATFIKVVLTGVMIVAGPWLLAILGIFVLGRTAASAVAEGGGLFMGVIVYTYAFSLVLMGGLHYLFTRFVADLVYEEREAEAGAALVMISVTVVLFAAALSWIAAGRLEPEVSLSYPRLFRVATVVFFVSVNLLWLEMIFVSLLRRYGAVFLTYLAGMALSVAGARILGGEYGAGGAMLGFASGQLFTALVLMTLSLSEWRPAKFGPTLKLLRSYSPRYTMLIAAGSLYTAAVWADKLVLWFARGEAVAGTYIRLFEPYDLAVYLANLAMIPGLVYFIVASETDFYIRLKEFLSALQGGTYVQIQERKWSLIRGLRRGLGEQTLFQGVLTVSLWLLAPAVLEALSLDRVDPGVFRLTVVAVFFHFLLMTLLTFLYYIESHGEAAVSAALVLVLNILITFALTLLLPEAGVYSAGYLLSTAAGSALAGFLLARRITTLDRTMYARYGRT
jgi:uncharacterized membrane protein